MRLSKIEAVAAILVCLLSAAPAQGRTGNAKHAAREQPGSKSAEARNSDGSAADDGLAEEEPGGEAKATLAPGVKRPAAVLPGNGGTGEADVAAGKGERLAAPGSSSQLIQGGRLQVFLITVGEMDARGLDSVRGYGPCSKVSNLEILSETEVKVTIDLSAVRSSGSCTLYFHAGRAAVFSADVSYKARK